MKNYAIRAPASYFLKLPTDGNPGATARWILYHKTDVAFTSFSSMRKPIIIRKLHITFLFLNFIFHYRTVVKKDHYMKHFLSYMQTTLSDASVAKSIVM